MSSPPLLSSLISSNICNSRLSLLAQLPQRWVFFCLLNRNLIDVGQRILSSSRVIYLIIHSNNPLGCLPSPSVSVIAQPWQAGLFSIAYRTFFTSNTNRTSISVALGVSSATWRWFTLHLMTWSQCEWVDGSTHPGGMPRIALPKLVRSKHKKC